MSEPRWNKGFESKVTELVAVTQRLAVPQILLLRRMTLADSEAQKWASPRQLDLIFTVILSKALERTDSALVRQASEQQFDPLLPQGEEADRDRERGLLFDLARPMLAGAAPSATETAEEVMETLDQAAEDEAPRSYGDFPTLFDETLTRYVRRILSALAVTGSRPHIPIPFVLAPQFAATYEKVLREMLLPTMRNSKRLRELAGSRDWTEEGASDRLVGMIQSRDTNNPVLRQWNTRWDAFHPETVLKGKDGRPRTRRPEDDPWPFFKEEAAKHGYIPPTPTDIPMLQKILLLEPEVLANAWHSLSQMYEQEFNPKSRAEQARAGAFRDGLIRTIEKLDLRAGDLLAIRAFYDFPRCDRMFLKQLIQTLGRSDRERHSKAPMLVAFYNDLPR